MKFITLSAPAKINLSLDITGRRDDGYHTLEMVLQTISLKDELLLEKTAEGIEIACNNPQVPCDETNICHKAARIFFQRASVKGASVKGAAGKGAFEKGASVKGGMKLQIHKKIPVGAGLAGGSTNAAAVLKGLNVLYDTGLSQEELLDMGLQCGADVPFCLTGGTCLARGIGEKLTMLPPFSGIHVILVMPDFPVSTAWVYQNYRLDDPVRHPDTQAMITAIRLGDKKKVAREMRNVLESVTAVKYPEIEGIKRDLKNRGAIGSIMSGSGPSVFGLFENKETARKAYSILQRQYEKIFLVTT